jgi:hypothetical protein
MGEPVYALGFGDIDGTGYLDLVAAMHDGNVYVYRGEDGFLISTISKPNDHSPEAIHVGEFDNDNDGDEILVLFERKQTPKNAFLVWYDESGVELRRSSNNLTDTNNRMAFGFITGGLTLDVVVGGPNEIAYVFKGKDGSLIWDYDLNTMIRGIVVGNFTGDQYADVALRDSDDDITVIDGETHLDIMTKYYTTGRVRNYYAADLEGDDGVDELVVSVVRYGVYAFDMTGDTVWFYPAPLVIGSRCLFDDFDRDGHTDLVFLNHEYINIVSGATERLLWHYVHDDVIHNPMVGHFIKVAMREIAPPDILSYSQYEFFVISGRAPSSSGDIHRRGRSPSNALVERIIMVSSVGIPVCILFIAIPMDLKKRRRKKE